MSASSTQFITADSRETEQGEVKSFHRPWGIALHTFFAFFILTYCLKGLYFIFAINPVFSLKQWPPDEDLWIYAVMGMAVALFSASIIIYTYRTFLRYLQRRYATPPVQPKEDEYRWFVRVAILLALIYLAINGPEAVKRISSGTVLARTIQINPEAFASGQLGVRALFVQMLQGIMFVFAVYAVKTRKWFFIIIATVYFISSAALSDGSRFTLLSSLLLIPFTYYMLWKRRQWHRRWAVTAIYFAVLVLPFLMGPLIVARAGRSGDILGMAVTAALVTFDGMDHLINYLYWMPVDWTGVRAFEELWQIIPRAVMPGKPVLYGLLSLQESLYPGTVGSGTGFLILGHYPLGFLVAGLDFFLIAGLVIHSAILGAYLAIMDWGIERKSFLLASFFLLNIFYVYNILRVGIENYIIAGLQFMFIPLAVTIFLLRLGKGTHRRAACMISSTEAGKT